MRKKEYEIAPQFKAYVGMERKLIPVDIEDIEIEPPPSNNSHTTSMELEDLVAIVGEGKLPEKVMEVADRDPLRLFTSICKKNKIDPLTEEATQYKEEWNKIAFDLKLKYKRPRPWELAAENDIELRANKTSSTESPSYPSGHAMMGYGLAEFYKKKYPYMEEQWDNIAGVIAHSRLQAGVHYPSDIKASKQVVDWVTSNSKTAADTHVETRRKQRAKFLDPKDLKKVESRVRAASDLPEGANYITLPHGRKAVVRTNKGKSHLATILGPAMRPPGKDVSSLIKEANANSILKTLEKVLTKVKAPQLADSVGLYRARKNLGNAVKDLHRYNEQTARFGQMPRIVIPKTHIDTKDLKRLGFRDSLVAVPEIGQKTWTTYRHPLDKIHLHDHGDLLNMHIDSLPSLQMLAERRSMPMRLKKKLLETIPEGIEVKLKSSKKHTLADTLKSYSEGIGHAILEGGPGYLNYGIKQLNPWKIGMTEEILSKLPKDYLKKRYGYTRKLGSFSNQLEKTSSIDLLTGRMGAGKSTLLNKLRDQYDIVEGTDLGSVVDDKFVEPTSEDKPRLRQEKADRLLAAHQAGKRVLIEGYPPGLFRIPGMVEAADRAVILEPDVLQRLTQIGKRSKERGTSVEDDIRYAVSPEFSAKEQKYLDMLRGAIEGTHVAPTSEEAEAYLLGKQANDLSVLTAVPKQNLDLIMRKGLASQKAISEDPELTEAFLRQRDLKEEDWRKELSDALKGFKPYSRLGASVFFSEPDPDKVSDPRHFINQFDTTKLRVNLGKLLKDIPETRFHGVELEPFNEEAWEADPDNYPSRRHRDLTTDEIAALTAKDPKELWKHYKDEYIGKLYAGDVPHGMVVTPSGIIPPEYLEQVEKTSSAKEQLKHILVTGHSGAGKSTYAKELAEELGMSYLEADEDLELRKAFSSSFPYPREDPTKTRDYISGEGKFRENLEEFIKKIKQPTVLDGAQFAWLRNPDLFSQVKVIEVPEGRRKAQREEREIKLDRVSEDPIKQELMGQRVQRFTEAADPQIEYWKNIIDSEIITPKVEKTSSAKEQLKHILVTGHSGAGKSTYAKELAEELGIPRHRLDVPAGPIMEAEYPGYWDDGTMGYPKDVSTRILQEALGLDTPHVIEGSHMLEVPELTEGYKRILVDTPEDRVIEQRAQREYRNRERKGKPYRPIEEHRDSAKELVNFYRDLVSNYRDQPGVESIVPEVKTSSAKDRLRSILTKTAEDQPLLRHRSTLLIRDPATNRLLAAKETDPNSKASPYFFPGGGLYDDEYDTPRNPTEEEVIEGARREALEELGIELDNPRVVGTFGQELEDWWKEKTLRNRGVPYLGGHEHYVLADKGREDRSLYNIEGDAFEQGEYHEPKEVYRALTQASKIKTHPFAPFNKEQARAIKEHLLSKVN